MKREPEARLSLERRQIQALVRCMVEAIVDHVDELTALDQAIGDGDHGFNMRRGVDALARNSDDIASGSLPEALTSIGRTLVMTIGGASGPLYGTLALAMGKALPATPTRDEISAALGSAIESVKQRGKSDGGQKTMLDVLIPVHAAIASNVPRPLEQLPVIAALAAEATTAMKAQRGRAAYLGVRSIGHMDPGARSASLIVGAVCRGLKGCGHG
jgi:phosphoenolpyruvate---glycerone phosphotransferase subunit DhaL